jgi:hypothetical protein
MARRVFLAWIVSFIACEAVLPATKGGYTFATYPHFQKVTQAAHDAINQDLTLPIMDNRGRIPTLNDMGFHFTIIDPVSEDFLNFIAQPENHEKTVLEIGGAYGNLAEKAVSRGVKHYILNDMDKRHLRIFARYFYSKHQNHTLEELLENIKLFEGRFPDNFPEDFPLVDVGIMNKVFHYFKPREIDATMRKLNRMTRMGGIWYVFVVSPYASTYEKFALVFESNKQRGYPFPGYCVDAKRYCVDAYNDKYVPGLPQTLWFFDQDELQKLFVSYGFKIEMEWNCDLPTESDKHWRPGKDVVGIRVRKIIAF